MKVFQYVLSDYYRYYGGGNFNLSRKAQVVLTALSGRNHCFSYTFWLRLASCPNVFRPLARLMHRRLSRKYGLQIPRGTRIGYGLYIGHGIGIVINPGTVIGNNCNLSQFLTIGSNHNTPAVIADEVYIGPSVCIVEDVHIGRGATIGAGAVVVKDVPEGATVAGVPARVLNCDHPGRYIGRKWPHC